MIDLGYFRDIWCVSAVTTRVKAERRTVRYLAARELRSRKLFRTSTPAKATPIPFNPRTLVATFDAASVLEALRTHGWPEPPHVIDLFAEYRATTNGQEDRSGLPTESPDLVTTAKRFDLEDIGLIAPDAFDTATTQEVRRHCETAVNLMPHLLAQVSQVAHALRRGAYATSVAAIQHRGIPLNPSLIAQAGDLHHQLQDLAEREYAGVFRYASCSAKRLRAWARRRGLHWPCKSGTPHGVDHFFECYRKIDDVFRLDRLRKALQRLAVLTATPVTREGRSHCDIRPFASTTGRNEPPRKRYAWEVPRSLIAPSPGMAMAIVDYSQQEIGIAAYLSGDQTMASHYENGDAFINFGREVGLVHCESPTALSAERKTIKKIVAPIMYGASEASIARKLGRFRAVAKTAIQTHKRIYPRFWEWRREAIRLFNQGRPLQTVYGWQRLPPHAAPTDVEQLMRSVANFPVQAHGTEILWSACPRIHEAGYGLLGVLHDAVLVEAPVDDIKDVCAGVSAILRDASQDVLSRPLKTAEEIAIHPEQFRFGSSFWAEASALGREQAEVRP